MKSTPILWNKLPSFRLSRITETPKDVMNEVDKLKYNKITSMLWEGSESDQTWTYYPEKNTIFHRHIHIGNFFKPRTNLVITEAMGEVSRDEMIAAGSKFQHLKNPLDYNVSDHAYVLFDANCRDSSNVAINYYRSKGLRLVGRFAEWDYFNMDVCIKSALDQLRDL